MNQATLAMFMPRTTINLTNLGLLSRDRLLCDHRSNRSEQERYFGDVHKPGWSILNRND
jgi:hypothetical protein